MKQSIFLFCLILVSVYCRAAADNIELSVIKKIYEPSQEIHFQFSLNSCSHIFKVRPFVDIGSVEIFNSKTASWVGSTSSWDSFPVLGAVIKVRVSNINNAKVTLGFEIQNTKIGNVTKSKGTKLWISDAYKNYVNVLNEGIVDETSASRDAKLNK